MVARRNVVRSPFVMERELLWETWSKLKLQISTRILLYRLIATFVDYDLHSLRTFASLYDSDYPRCASGWWRSLCLGVSRCRSAGSTDGELCPL